MTDLLSGLRRRPGGDYASYAIGYNKALDDVREALCNPPDAEVRRIADATALPEWAVRVVLDRAAGSG